MRKVGGAHRGVDMWLVQRASAVYMACFIPAFLVLAWGRMPLDYAAWRGLFAPLAMKLAMLLFVFSLLVHAWVGLREIFIDYLHVLVLRLGLYFAFWTMYAACLAWTVDILWGMH
ncbi:MAG TPA: succinate dehydrogenase, hydrophobic membrane anchor protein [Thiobacillaceae bacterium]|nr:succinate dehydrogenase, hydrophobic membrane anchor protein [Thiobacillaceae bacterium]HNU63529.1 succinate dehydrogenase, hydrophobic membrane anchor protein [Thiobacillaceae bacterium]